MTPETPQLQAFVAVALQIGPKADADLLADFARLYGLASAVRLELASLADVPDDVIAALDAIIELAPGIIAKYPQTDHEAASAMGEYSATVVAYWTSLQAPPGPIH